MMAEVGRVPSLAGLKNPQVRHALLWLPRLKKGEVTGVQTPVGVIPQRRGYTSTTSTSSPRTSRRSSPSSRSDGARR